MRNRLLGLACLIGLVALPGLAHAQVTDMSLRTLQHNPAYAVKGIAASPSGDTVATIWNDQLILWRTSDGEQLYTTYPYPGSTLNCVAYNPNGSQIAVGRSYNVYLINAITGAFEWGLDGLTNPVSSIAFTFDGSSVVGGDTGGNVYRWSTSTGLVQTDLYVGMPVRSLAISPDNSFIAVGFYGIGQIAVYPIGGGERIRTIEGHAGDINGLAFSPDGTYLVSAGSDGTIRKWRFGDGTPLFTIPDAHDGEPVTCLVIGPGDNDGFMIASGGDDYNLRLWDLATGDPGSAPGVLTGHTASITGVTLLGTWGGATSSADGTAKIWGEGGGQPPVEDKSAATFEHGAPVLGVAASPSGDTAATVAGELVRLWGEAGNLLTVNPELGQLSAIAYSPNGSKIAVGGEMYVQILDAATLGNAQWFQGLQASVKNIAFSPDGSKIAAGDAAGNLYVWNTSDGSVAWRKVELGGAVNGVAFSPDGAFVVAGGAFGNYGARLFDAVTGAPGNNFYGNEGPITGVAFSSSGDRLVSSGMDGSIRSWHFPSPDTAVTIIGAHSGSAVNCIAVKEVETGINAIASGGDDNTLKIWELATGQQDPDSGDLTGHTGPVVSVAFLGNWGGITGSLDGTAKVWGGDEGPSGPTTISGMINSTTWRRNGSPYRIVDAVWIPEGQHLDIESGVEVQFVTNVPFLVYGSMNTYGGYMDSVRFHGYDSNWGGIRFMPSGFYSNSSLNGAVIEGATVPGGAMFADSCGGGVYVGPGRQVQINGSVIRANNAPRAGGGIYVDSGSLSLNGSVVEGNSAGFFGGGIGNANSSVNVSQSVVRYNYSEQYGGGIAAVHQAEVHLWQTAVERNYAQSEGGGIAVYDSVYLHMENSFVEKNSTFGIAGGIMARKAAINSFQSVIGGNNAEQQGGAIYADSSQVGFFQSTIADNSSMGASGELALVHSSIEVRNSIIWGNTSPAYNFNYVSGQANYSDLQDNWPGDAFNSISVDPAFMIDPMAGNTYQLTMGSMCIDSGDPQTGTDPDGTRRDMGAFFFWQEGMQKQLVMPQIAAQPGSEVLVDIRATHQGLVSADLFFTIDSNVFTPAEDFIRWHVFEGTPAAQPEVVWTISGDTVKISLATNTEYPAYLNDSPLLTLAFDVNPEAEYGWYGLNWLQSVWKPETEEWVYTNLNEEQVYMEWGGIELQRFILWGDVTMDQTVSGADASAILRHVVGLPNATFDRQAADVTGNGWVSSFDAALILRKVLFPWFQFPVEGPRKLAAAGAAPFASLSWERDGSGWVLRSNTSGIEAGELTLTLPGDAPVTISGDNAFAYRQDGTTVQIALVNAAASGILFRVDGVASAPMISTASFNEGAMTLAPMLPTAFALEQNAPNPFNPSTTIRFALPEASQVNLVVYDLNGRAIRTLAAGAFQPGNHSVVWDGLDANGREVASGTYVYRLTTEKGSFVKRMTLAR